MLKCGLLCAELYFVSGIIILGLGIVLYIVLGSIGCWNRSCCDGYL